MAFNLREVNSLLAACHRRCCICHRFCGVKIETDHIQPKAKRGSDNIENCLPVCFECHAEIHSYSDEHPRGRKFRTEELQAHREQWLRICQTRPEVFTEQGREADVGPLQALIDELEFNAEIAKRSKLGCLFLNDQFRRAIEYGVVSVIQPHLKQAITEAYAVMGRANQMLIAFINSPNQTDWMVRERKAAEAVAEAPEKISKAHKELLKFLGTN